MRRLALVGVVIAGVVLAAGSLAGDDFEITHEGDVPAEEVLVPGADGQDIEELAKEYARALELVQEAAAPIGEVPVPDSVRRGIPADLADQVMELAFAVLASDLDLDGDGISNLDEKRFGTDANHPDTDRDGYIDGLEAVRGYNPLVASPGDKVDFTAAGVEEGSTTLVLSITGVRLDQEVLIVTGTGPSNTLVTLFVFSVEAQVVLVRTDTTGRFRVVLGDTLEQGDHRAYAALTDAGGKASQVSPVFAFERMGDAIKLPESSPQEQAAAVDSDSPLTVLVAAAIAGLIVLIAGGIAVLWWWARKKPFSTS